MYVPHGVVNALGLNGIGTVSVDEVFSGAKAWMSPATIPGKLSGASTGMLLGIVAVPLALFLLLKRGR